MQQQNSAASFQSLGGLGYISELSSIPASYHNALPQTPALNTTLGHDLSPQSLRKNQLGDAQ